MSEQTLRLLCVHGIGHQEADPNFRAGWTNAITTGLRPWNPSLVPDIQFVDYDELFAENPLTPIEMAEALFKLGTSGLIHGLGGLFGQSRGFGDVPETLRWTAGMVAQWAADDKLRNTACQRVLDAVAKFQPHVICAHSLGTLISYDAFARPANAAALAGRRFVSFGSQIGNPFVRSTLGGRIVPLPVERWTHLFNPHDKAFTAQLRLADPRFEQITTEFDLPDMLDHNAVAYLSHANTANTVWRTLATLPTAAPAGKGLRRALAKPAAPRVAAPAILEKPQRRALLVGINEYPDPAHRLQGCVNDVFLMSSVLQECGFDAEDIRVVLDDRATAAGVRERMEWLLDGAQDGQDRVFFYSGHGAQLPGYGAHEKIDHTDECLVTYDFNWTRETAFIDEEFYDLYSQLPYGAHFLAILDCCHSGGMTRDGGPRVRGLTPPDDIRHRMLKWNTKLQMWETREMDSASRAVTERKQHPATFGAQGATQRLGRAGGLWSPDKNFDAARQRYGHRGPFLPVLLEACGENQYAYEYRHGVQSYGAFTYTLSQVFRECRQQKKRPSWQKLIEQTTARLHKLNYDQTPVLVGPAPVTSKPVPW